MERNDDLRSARLSRSSPHDPSAALSRAELAELAAAEVYRRTGRVAPIDAHYVARLERGAIRWPGREYRQAFTAVLGASGRHRDYSAISWVLDPARGSAGPP